MQLKGNPVTSRLKLNCKTTITEIESKIPNICGLVTNSELPAVENKILDVINLVKKTRIMMQNLVELENELLMMITMNILLLQNLIV